jgi:hypothetical protein
MKSAKLSLYLGIGGGLWGAYFGVHEALENKEPVLPSLLVYTSVGVGSGLLYPLSLPILLIDYANS